MTTAPKPASPWLGIALAALTAAALLLAVVFGPVVYRKYRERQHLQQVNDKVKELGRPCKLTAARNPPQTAGSQPETLSEAAAREAAAREAP